MKNQNQNRTEALARASEMRATHFDTWRALPSGDPIEILRRARLAELHAFDVIIRWLNLDGDLGRDAALLAHRVREESAPSLVEAEARATEASRIASRALAEGVSPDNAAELGRLAGLLEAAERLRVEAARAGLTALGGARLAALATGARS